MREKQKRETLVGRREGKGALATKARMFLRSKSGRKMLIGRDMCMSRATVSYSLGTRGILAPKEKRKTVAHEHHNRRNINKVQEK